LALRRQYLTPGLITYYRDPLLIVEGHMQYLWDEHGGRYLGAFAGIVTVSVGHCHPYVVEKVRAQVGKLQHTTTIYLYPTIGEFGRNHGRHARGDGAGRGIVRQRPELQARCPWMQRPPLRHGGQPAGGADDRATGAEPRPRPALPLQMRGRQGNATRPPSEIETGINGETLDLTYRSGETSTVAVGTYAITVLVSNGTGKPYFPHPSQRS
jgi:hypothetical protein